MPDSDNQRTLELLDWPNRVTTAAGGTRTTIKLNRPWESFVPVDADHCPFCQRGSEEPSVFPVESGWKIIQNAFTPFPYHRLIVPTACWPLETLQELGGAQQIWIALKIAVAATILDHKQNVRLGVHIGSLAGQNIGHLHYHLLEPIRTPSVPDIEEQLRREVVPELYVMDTEQFTISAGGIRAGQLLIVPKNSMSVAEDANLQTLAEVLALCIALAAKKFQSLQGNPPEFMMGLSFCEGRFSWGFYLPILNHMGFTEYFGMMEGTPMVLPWRHSQTAAFLRAGEPDKDA